MPVNMLTTTGSFKQEDVVHAGRPDPTKTRSLTVDPDKVTADANAQKIIKPGAILYKIAGAEKHRVGIRSKLEAAITTSDTSIELVEEGKTYTNKTARYFADGDVLKVLRPYGTVTLSATWAIDDTVTVTIDGHGITYTAASATLFDVATGLAAAINADPIAGQIVEAIADGVVVYIFAKELRVYSLAEAVVTAGTGEATASGTELTGNVTVGTVNASGVNTTAGTLTLTSTAAIALPAGAPIGIEGTPYGVILAPYDLLDGESDVSAYGAVMLYEERLPYWDGDIAKNLPELTFV